MASAEQECRICFEPNAQPLGCYCIDVYEHPLCVYNTLLFSRRFQDGDVICTVCRRPTIYAISDMKLYEGYVSQESFVKEFPLQLLDETPADVDMVVNIQTYYYNRTLRGNLAVSFFFQVANYAGNCAVMAIYSNMKTIKLYIDCDELLFIQGGLAITLCMTVVCELRNFINISYPVHPYLCFKYILLTLMFLTFPIYYGSYIAQDKCIESLYTVSIGNLVAPLLYVVGIYKSIRREQRIRAIHHPLPLQV